VKITAKLYDGKSSKEHNVVVEFTPTKRLRVDSFNIDFPLEEVDISSRLGSTPRVIHLPNGMRLKSEENDKIDEILKSLNISHSKTHNLERSWKIAIASIVLIAAFVVFMLTAGADYSADILAKFIPKESLDYASKKALSQLDRGPLHKSNLTQDKKIKILKMFKSLTKNEKRYKLHFRSSPQIGPNAFALPSGDIVLLDELVFLDKDKELKGILGVLAHEKAHIVYKHSLKGLIKGSIAATVISYVSGDLSFMVTTLPTLIVTSKYSREFESQADRYAKEQLKSMGESTKPLAKLFINLEEYEHKRNKDSNVSKYLNIFSTHPITQKRIEYFMKD